MKPAPFTYHAPSKEDDALSLIALLPDARIINGGQSLMPMLAMRYAYCGNLVDIGRIASLKLIEDQGATLRIGATVTQAELLNSDAIEKRAPVMTEALAHVGHLQTRNRGTFVGSLCHADPASEQPLLAALLNARVNIASTRGKRQLAYTDFTRGYLSTALASDELAIGIEIDPWPASHGYAFDEFARRRGDFAIVGCGVLIQLDASKRVERLAVGLCGIASTPLRLAAFEQASVGCLADEALSASLVACLNELAMSEDVHVPVDYRRRLSITVSTRALQRAIERAKERMNGDLNG